MEQKIDLNNLWETRTITQEIVSAPASPGDARTFTLHVDVNTNSQQRFELYVAKELGRPVGAW